MAVIPVLFFFSLSWHALFFLRSLSSLRKSSSGSLLFFATGYWHGVGGFVFNSPSSFSVVSLFNFASLFVELSFLFFWYHNKTSLLLLGW